MIGFIVALDSEASAILTHSTIISQSTVLKDRHFYRIEIGGVPAVLLVCGAGKVFSAIATQYVIDNYAVNYIVNIGTCGGVAGEVQLAKVYLVNKCAQYDFDVSEIDSCAPGVIGNFSTPFIPINNLIQQKLASVFDTSSLATGDRFTQCDDTARYIKQHFDCPLRDMEGASIALVCYSNGIPLLMLKGVSDYVGSQSVNMYLENSATALDSIGDKIIWLSKLIDEHCGGSR